MKRVIPGLGLAGGWLLLLFFGTPLFFSIVLILIASVASFEYLRMIGKSEENFDTRYLFVPLYLLPIISVVWTSSIDSMHFGFFAAWVLTTLLMLRNYVKINDVLGLYCKLVFGVFYVGCLTTYLYLIYLLPHGNLWLVILSAITAGSDTGAYVVGCSMGKHKLCPNISPNKTIEGALGGLVFGVLVAVIFGWLILPDVSVTFVIIAAILLNSASIVGDLTESIIKRGTGTKDSGTILAGHGGVLDRMDSMLFAAPFLYYLLLYARGL